MNTMPRKTKPRQVVWCDRGWQRVYYGFCPNEAAFKHALVKFKIPAGHPYPTQDAATTTLEGPDGKLACIVTLSHKFDRARRKGHASIMGMLVHEATHVWQKVRDHMGEKAPSEEFEAYSMQAIFQNIYVAYLDTRGNGK